MAAFSFRVLEQECSCLITPADEWRVLSFSEREAIAVNVAWLWLLLIRIFRVYATGETEGYASSNHNINELYEGKSERAHITKSCQMAYPTALSVQEGGFCFCYSFT